MKPSIRHLAAAIAALALVGCSTSPPPPVQPQGDWRPVNVPKAAPAGLDYTYSGGVLGALPALQKVAPALTVLAPEGQGPDVPVAIDLRGTTVQRALREISDQAGDIADVVWTSTAVNPAGGQVHIRFRTTDPKGASNDE